MKNGEKNTRKMERESVYVHLWCLWLTVWQQDVLAHVCMFESACLGSVYMHVVLSRCVSAMRVNPRGHVRTSVYICA